MLKQLENSFPKTIFINLDENTLIYPENKIRKMLKLVPNLDEITKKLKEIYFDFNKENNGFIYNFKEKEKKRRNTEKNPNLVKQKFLIYNQNKSEDEKCKNIFEIFKKSFENFTLKKLPEKPVFQKELDHVFFIITYMIDIINTFLFK